MGLGGVITFVRTISTTGSKNKSHKLRKTCEKACPNLSQGDDQVPEVVKTLSTASSENKPLKHSNFQKP